MEIYRKSGPGYVEVLHSSSLLPPRPRPDLIAGMNELYNPSPDVTGMDRPLDTSDKPVTVLTILCDLIEVRKELMASKNRGLAGEVNNVVDGVRILKCTLEGSPSCVHEYFPLPTEQDPDLGTQGRVVTYAERHHELWQECESAKAAMRDPEGLLRKGDSLRQAVETYTDSMSMLLALHRTGNIRCVLG